MLSRRRFLKRAGLWVPAVAYLALPRNAAAALPASDAFTDTDGVALSTHNANWAYTAGSFEINTNSVYNSSGGGGWGCARWTGDTFPNDQYSQVVIAAIAGSVTLGVAARIATGGAVTFYGAYWMPYYVELFKFIAGSYSMLATDSTLLSVSDVMRLEVIGTGLTLKRNGSSLMTATDSDITAGAAGLCGHYGAASARLDTWEAGATGGGPPPATGRRRVVIFQ